MFVSLDPEWECQAYLATWSIIELILSLAHTYTQSGDKGGPDSRGQRACDRRDTLMRKSTWAGIRKCAVVAFWNDPYLIKE